LSHSIFVRFSIAAFMTGTGLVEPLAGEHESRRHAATDGGGKPISVWVRAMACRSCGLADRAGFADMPVGNSIVAINLHTVPASAAVTSP